VVAWVLHSSFPVRQASFPTRALEPVIRMEGLGAAARWINETFALAPEVCMTLIEVKQRSEGRVKNECSMAQGNRIWIGGSRFERARL
jgi:hypothetical protein